MPQAVPPQPPPRDWWQLQLQVEVRHFVTASSLSVSEPDSLIQRQFSALKLRAENCRGVGDRNFEA